MAAKRSPRTKSRSGAQWSEADYRAAGYGTIKVRLSHETIAKLGVLADKLGTNRAKLLASMIAAEWQHLHENST